MKELQNLTSLNAKKLLVVLPVKKVQDLFLNECAFSLAQQTYPIDLLVLYAGNEGQERSMLETILNKPHITIKEQVNPEEPAVDKVIEADKTLNYIIEKTESHKFQSIFNEAFNYAEINGYESFSLIEPEDVLDANWFTYVNRYSAKKPDFDGFLPLTREVSNGAFLGFGNEACWVENYAEVAGTYDLQLLMRFNCMNITGAVFKTTSLATYAENVNGVRKIMKEDFKLTYSYEFFLRMVYNDKKFFTIPRLGYEHRMDIPSEIIDPFSSKIPRNIAQWPEDKGGMVPEEIKFWNETAKKEYFIGRHDRPIQFTKKAVA
jgi:hypothetical protein